MGALRAALDALPLRLRLIAAGGVVQLVAVACLLWGSTDLLDRTLGAQVSDQVRLVAALLDPAVTPALAARDYATLQQTLDQVRNDDPVRYLVLHDHRGRPVVTSGWNLADPLPARENGVAPDALERLDTTLHLAVPVVLAGQPLGRLDIGLSTHRLRAARSEFLRRSTAIATTALLVSMVAFAIIALAITRRLARLAQASQRVAQGHFDVTVAVTGTDEIGRLATGFNTMAVTIQQRVAALEHSERCQHELLDSLREQHARLTTLLGALRSGILFVDGDGRVLYANPAFVQLWSLGDEGDMAGRTLGELLPRLRQRVMPDDAAHFLDPGAGSGRLSGGMGVGSTTALSPLRTLDGRRISQRLQLVAAEAPERGWLWCHDDVTLECQARQHAWEALHDPLTRLLNRRGIDNALDHALHDRQQHGTPLTLMFIDLDDFKRANDLGGHRTGDEILVAVGRVLTSLQVSGPCQRLVAARLGGDEFAVLCADLHPDTAAVLAQQVIDSVTRMRFSSGPHTLRIGCSIGLADALPQESADALVARADAAMYRAKQQGKNGWVRHGRSPSPRSCDQAGAACH